MQILKRIQLEGFKSIKSMDLELTPMNVLIGANGAGKSNLISFFKMLNEMMGGRLQEYIAKSGRAQSLLHFGPKVTPQMSARLEFHLETATDTYFMRLFHAYDGSLMFADETLSYQMAGWAAARDVPLGAGHVETRIKDQAIKDDKTARTFQYLLNNIRVYHFHDTSATAPARQYSYRGDKFHLMPDAGNIAAVLFGLREDQPDAYGRIVETIRQIAPFFHDFELEPDGRDIILNWRHVGRDTLFGPHQLSDGTLRAICLVTLFLQPSDKLPNMIVVDEPELGLHPYALDVIAGLITAASLQTQVLISTQSSALLDYFEPEDIIVADRVGEVTNFVRPDADKLREWLEDYTLGEVWEKNVIGGGPH